MMVPTGEYHGRISREQILKDKEFYNKHIHKWMLALETRKGPYFSIIAPMLLIKAKELNEISKTGLELLALEKDCYGVLFCIYYRTRLYFTKTTRNT